MNPGNVSSPERAAPPGIGAVSRTCTSKPACASTIAAASPFGPLPITTAVRFIRLNYALCVFDGCRRSLEYSIVKELEGIRGCRFLTGAVLNQAALACMSFSVNLLARTPCK